jgi:hypothetical protein
MLTITGKGFPDISSPGALAGINITTFGGGACTPLTSNYTTITCTTAPSSSSSSTASAGLPFKGWYSGMRGVQYEFLNRTATPSQLPTVLNWTVEGVGAGSTASVLQSSWESTTWEQWPHCTRSRAFFTAPRAGNYSFLMSADDWGMLNGTWFNVSASLLVLLLGAEAADECQCRVLISHDL